MGFRRTARPKSKKYKSYLDHAPVFDHAAAGLHKASCDLLEFLKQNPNRPLMTSEIVDYLIHHGHMVKGKTINTTIHRLRLGHPEGHKIQTVRKYGYYFKDEDGGNYRVEAKDERYK